MRIEKNGHAISTIDDWARLAGPKAAHHWVEGRSAFELAHAWLATGTPSMPQGIHELLESRAETRGLSVDVVHPEHRIPFDLRPGEPRNADLAFLGRTGSRTVAVTIEGKADEPFGASVGDTLAAALERWLTNDRSGGIRRVMDLVDSLLPPSQNTAIQAGGLRYQLLTAAAGTLAFAAANGADHGVLIVHEFATDRTRDTLHAKNDDNYRAFLHRLGSAVPAGSAPTLSEPVVVPGGPLFEKPVPLFLGKVTSRVTR